VVNTVWNRNSCRGAAPIKNWSDVSLILIIGYSIDVFFFTLNLIIGNNGGTIHLICLRITQAFFIVPVILLAYIAISSQSYGTRKDAYFSWYGGYLSISGITYSVTSPPTGWVSDKK
jgi:ABC-type dipeptide/oligopeptide/nickel transport system permease subunit